MTAKTSENGDDLEKVFSKIEPKNTTAVAVQ